MAVDIIVLLQISTWVVAVIGIVVVEEIMTTKVVAVETVADIKEEVAAVTKETKTLEVIEGVEVSAVAEIMETTSNKVVITKEK
jgi:hypothetical protein